MKKRIFTLLLVLLLGLVLVACDTETASKTPGDGNKLYTTVTNTLHLSREYEGKNFVNDGIGRATVELYTDGDTTRFSLEGTHESVVVRYYSVNTPESTGGVEKWGKAASLFTKKQLSEAEEIVLEGVDLDAPATKEGYGRYLGYVWIRRAGETQFINLNVLIVENGYSENKGVNTSKDRYYSYFNKAAKNAANMLIHIWAPEDVVDELYSDEPIEMTIKHFAQTKDDLDSIYYSPDTDSGAKVHFEGYVKSLRLSSTGTYTFVIGEYDEEANTEYTLNLYAGYASASGSKIKVGSYLNIIGVIQKFNGVFQVSGINYSSLYQNPTLTYVIDGQSSYYLRFSNTAVAGYYENDGKSVYSNLTVTSVSVSDGVLTITGTAKLASKDGLAEEATEFVITSIVPNNYSSNLKAGDSITFEGIQAVKDSCQIRVVNYKTITK